MSKPGGAKPPAPPQPPAATQDEEEDFDDDVDEADEYAEAYDEKGGRSGGGGGGRKGSHGGAQERVHLHSGKGTRHKVELLEHGARRSVSPPPTKARPPASGQKDKK